MCNNNIGILRGILAVKRFTELVKLTWLDATLAALLKCIHYVVIKRFSELFNLPSVFVHSLTTHFDRLWALVDVLNKG